MKPFDNILEWNVNNIVVKIKQIPKQVRSLLCEQMNNLLQNSIEGRNHKI